MLATQVPENVFAYIQKNAGVVLNAFDPSKGEVSRAAIKGATNGGISFKDTLSTKDNGEDVDNMPAGMMEMIELEDRDIHVSGTFISVTPHTVRDLAAVADENESDGVKVITPRQDIEISDFQKTMWIVWDYGKGGFIAIRLDNVLNTAGLSIQSTNKGKGQFAFDFKAHYSMSDPDKVPYEIFIKEGSLDGAEGSTGEPHDDAPRS